MYTFKRMSNFYDYISSDLYTNGINPKKSIQELIIDGTLFNAPKSLNKFIEKNIALAAEQENINNNNFITGFADNIYNNNEYEENLKPDSNRNSITNLIPTQIPNQIPIIPTKFIFNL